MILQEHELLDETLQLRDALAAAHEEKRHLQLTQAELQIDVGVMAASGVLLFCES